MIGVGVIGVGRFGTHHADAYARSPRARLVAVADSDTQRAEAAGARLGVPWHDDPRALLDRRDIDAVSIATPATTHASVALDAIAAGKHVLVEKPLADAVAGARAVAEAARRSNVCVLVGHVFRFEPNFAAAQAAIAAGDFGRPLTVFARLHNPIGEARVTGPAVSIHFHLGVHPFDLALWFLGRAPRRVTAVPAHGRVWETLGVPDGVVTTIETDGGGLAVVDTFWSLPDAPAAWRTPASWTPAITDLSARVLCADGVVAVGGPGTVQAWDRDGFKTPNTQVRPWIHGAPRGALWEEIQHFIACCHGEATPLVTADDATVAVRVAEAAALSQARGSPVVIAMEPALA